MSSCITTYPYIVIDDHGNDVNHFNNIIDLNDKGIGVRQSFLKWALRAQRIDLT